MLSLFFPPSPKFAPCWPARGRRPGCAASLFIWHGSIRGAMDDLLLRLLSDEATEEELRRVDAQPHLLLPSLTRWVDERLHALLVDAAASGEAVAPRRAADLRAVASPTMAPRASAPAAVPKASDFPPLAAALPLGAALAAPRRVGGAKQRRRMAPTQVAVPSSSQTSVPSPAPFGQ